MAWNSGVAACAVVGVVVAADGFVVVVSRTMPPFEPGATVCPPLRYTTYSPTSTIELATAATRATCDTRLGCDMGIFSKTSDARADQKFQRGRLSLRTGGRFVL